MKMSSDLDQWLISPKKTSKQPVSDPLAAFRKMSISSTAERKFCLPSILTSGNNSTWLATRKNDNDLAKSSANNSNQNQSGLIKINQDDNAKWLLKPTNKTETDLVTLTDLEDWLLVPSGTNPDSPVGGKNTRKTSTSTNGEKISTNPLDEWEKQSLTYNWIVNDNNTSHVEEWLKKALEEDEIDEISDDFDDCSIEVIDQN